MAAKKSTKPRTRTSKKAIAVETRGERLIKKFPIGSKVIVSKVLPSRNDWPGFVPEMNQFFSGMELEVIGHYYDPFVPDTVCLLLNTKAHGAKANHKFSAEWVAPADAELLDFELISTKKRPRASTKAQKVASLRGSITMISERGQAVKMPIEVQIPEEMKMKFPEPESILAPPEPAPVAVPEIKTEPAKKESFGLGATFAASFLTAVGVAAAKKMKEKKDSQTPHQEKKKAASVLDRILVEDPVEVES